MADYLESYAAAFELPVHTGVRVDALGRTDAGMFLVAAGDRRYEADNVVIATGPFQRPYVPEFAGELGATVTQLHSSAYRNPRELPDGDALVVGAGNSGADIALELAAGRRVLLSGDLGGQIPINIEGLSGRMMFPILWRVWTYVLTFGTPVGRRALPKMEGNEPRIRVKRKHLVAAGVESVSRTVGVRDGRPLLADGTVVDAATVVWATGYRPAYDWVDLPVLGAGGEIETDHAGAALSQPGLYRLGRPFLYAFNSHTVGGVGRDAERIARRIAAAARPTDEYRLAVASVAA
jgi:putative flavoprotein involved in K+ transport